MVGARFLLRRGPRGVTPERRNGPFYGLGNIERKGIHGQVKGSGQRLSKGFKRRGL